MNDKNFIITLTGPSQSGKSLLMKKVHQLGERLEREGVSFFPEIVRKYTTRFLRLEEEKLIEKGEQADVEHIQQIPEDCDLVYQTYGVRYGIGTKFLSNQLDKERSPIIVINDIRAVEEIRKVFTGRVLSLFLFRKVPELEDFKKEAQNRGNVSESEVVARYEKAIAIYRTYIENIVLFDNVILNSIEYDSGKEQSENTILDFQLRNVLLPVITGKKELRDKVEYPKSSRIFVVAGNAASGKDEIVRALMSMGKLQAKVLPKYTMRQQEPRDGREMICQYVPKKSILAKLRKEYFDQKNWIAENLSRLDIDFSNEYKEAFLLFQRKLEEKNEDEYKRFWNLVTKKVVKENQQTILNDYFEENTQYVDLLDIKRNEKKICSKHSAAVYEKDGARYLIYGTESRLYGCDITEIEDVLKNNKHHLIIVASQLEVVNILKKLYGNKKVRLLYAHSEISETEFEANATDITKKEKKKEFRKILNNYTKEISNYDHVLIYAKSRLTYEQTSKEEELIDQMFRLLRAY